MEKTTNKNIVKNDMETRINEYELKMHERNRRRIKDGIKCLIFVPIIFFFMMIVTESSKLIFLVLWIISLFLICLFLIGVEYADFKLQEQINYIHGNDYESSIDLMDYDKQIKERLSKLKENISTVASNVKEEITGDVDEEGDDE